MSFPPHNRRTRIEIDGAKQELSFLIDVFVKIFWAGKYWLNQKGRSPSHMITNSSNLNAYADYLESRSVEELREMGLSIDSDRYPECYELIKRRLDKIKTDLTPKKTALATNSISNWFKSPAVHHDKRISWTYILFSLGILSGFCFLGHILGQWNTIIYRPWLIWPIFTSIFIAFTSSMIVYGIKACKISGYWPLFSIRSSAEVVMEFFKSLLLLIPIRIAIGLVILIVGVFIHTDLTENGFIRFASYTSNSWIVVGWLTFIFTIGPVIEEIFFRGFLYNVLKTKFSLAMACIIQAIIFTLYHQYNFLQSLWIFLFGVALAVIYERRDNLLSPCFVHCINNAIIALPLLFVAVGNLHPVAKSFEEAAHNPYWLVSSPPEYIERKATGYDQLKYAMDTWGSSGTKQWKKEANAFQAVSFWFPDDRVSAAKAKLGLICIYRYYLRDYRRAVIAAKELRQHYPDQKEQSASALSEEGWSYYMLKDFKDSRKAFVEVIKHYYKYNTAVESAQRGLRWLEIVNY